MTAVTALFMLPAALVFPSLLRKANTPPPSATLAWRRRRHREITNGRHLREMSDEDYAKSRYEQAAREMHEDFMAALKAGEKLLHDRPSRIPERLVACDLQRFTNPPPEDNITCINLGSCRATSWGRRDSIVQNTPLLHCIY